MSKIISSCLVAILVLVEVLTNGGGISVNSLSMDYYGMRCPSAETIVRNIVDQAMQKDFTLAAGLLRMHFHDCFVQGCDGSVLIDTTKDNTAEKDSPANLSLHGFEIIDQIKQIIENMCPGIVSCADILAMAARDAVYWAGGPSYDIPKGRKDGSRSRMEDTINLPSPLSNISTLIKMFGQHGFNVVDLVALSGGHTLGVARCSSFKNRLSNFDSASNVDPSLNPNLANMLRMTCSAGDNTVAALDWTRSSFDNAYFIALQMGAGVLTSDQSLLTSSDTGRIVSGYAMNQEMFFYDFSNAMVKMGLLDVKEGVQGEVRLDCRKVNY